MVLVERLILFQPSVMGRDTYYNALHHLVKVNYQREIITLSGDNVSVINSVYVCSSVWELDFFQKSLRKYESPDLFESLFSILWMWKAHWLHLLEV